MSKFPDQAGISEVSDAGISSSKLLRNIKGFIVDFDGTLFDNALLPFYLISAYPPDIFRLWKERKIRRQFAGCDYSTPEQYYRAFFAALGKACSRSPEKMRAWYFNRYMPRMIRALKKHYQLRPGVMELFRRLDAAYNTATYKTGNKALLRVLSQAMPALTAPPVPKLAVYSDYPFLKERLEALGLSPGPGIFLYGPESFGAQKPATRPFLSIASDLGVTPEEVLVIGDREDSDGLGAFHAGMRFFCLETGHKRYFRLDPYRSPPLKNAEAHGPSLLMHAGTWDHLINLLIEKYG